MKIYDSCQASIDSCLFDKSFSIAWLYNDEKAMGIHTHDCYEVYFSISGGKQFLIDNSLYEFKPGDIFFINQLENHYLSKVEQVTHERIVIFIEPKYLESASTLQTDLRYCFTHRDPSIGHRVSLTKEEQSRFMYFIHNLSEKRTFGQDIFDQALFLELITFLNTIYMSRCAHEPELIQSVSKPHHSKINEVMSYINQHLSEDLSITALSSQFYISSSYLRRIFKDATDTTVNQYVIAKRISCAKVLLSEGYAVAEVSRLCGFGDYSSFLKSFTKVVGVSPKKYSTYAHK